MIDVCRQSKVGITAALVSCHHQFTLFYLKLNEAQARCLVALRISGPKKKHVILAVPFFPVDTLNERRYIPPYNFYSFIFLRK